MTSEAEVFVLLKEAHARRQVLAVVRVNKQQISIILILLSNYNLCYTLCFLSNLSISFKFVAFTYPYF